ncbi:hypothetical protein QR680_006419 [Steinernema hermaphroditum]|uniref:Uncharacterized protein n=1 Tax=Steinernema hermaphroditum TaxID=289476 RepID=A0AA39LXD4_9BILA|nr:hypothetical protein QR680_006419 [Steinernema hermaphroditum]
MNTELHSLEFRPSEGLGYQRSCQDNRSYSEPTMGVDQLESTLQNSERDVVELQAALDAYVVQEEAVRFELERLAVSCAALYKKVSSLEDLMQNVELSQERIAKLEMENAELKLQTIAPEQLDEISSAVDEIKATATQCEELAAAEKRCLKEQLMLAEERRTLLQAHLDELNSRGWIFGLGSFVLFFTLLWLVR